MGVTTIAGIDDVHIGGNMPCDQMRSTALLVTNNENVGVHGGKIGNGIQKTFPFDLGRRGDIEIQNVGRKTHGSDFKSHARSRAGLKKDIENRHAAQKRHQERTRLYPE